MVTFDVRLVLSSGDCYRVDGEAIEIAIPMDFEGAQARAFGMPVARRSVVRGGDFVGARRLGGAVNCNQVILIPHGNGTHTESAGHIMVEANPVGDLAGAALQLSLVVQVDVERLGSSGESYGGESDEEDRVITARSLKGVVKRWESEGLVESVEALVVGIKGAEKPAYCADFSGTNPPYFTREAMEWIVGRGIRHLLVELPSVDREEDGGTVPNHHLYFEGTLKAPGAVSPGRNGATITEMIYLPERVAEGLYALSLRFARWNEDAAPSRPILYRLEPV